MPVELIIGPPVTAMSRTAAERALLENPELPEGAEVSIATHAGHYVAAVGYKLAGPPFEGGGPADSAEESAGPKSEGPDDSEPSEGGESESKSEGGESSSDSSSESKPPSEGGEHGEHGKGGEAHAISQLTQLVQAIADALGVSLDAGLGSPVPGADAGMGGPAGPPMPPAPHGAGPAGPPAPHPAGPAGPGGPDAGNQHVIHEKAGPPSIPTFSNVQDHPWAATVGKVAHFRVAEEIADDKDLAEVESELQAIAAAGGFIVARFKEERNEAGRRVAAAIIRTPKTAQE